MNKSLKLVAAAALVAATFAIIKAAAASTPRQAAAPQIASTQVAEDGSSPAVPLEQD